ASAAPAAAPLATAGFAGELSPAGAKAAAPLATAVADTPVAIASPGVRAGEWDDNANYRDFLGYIGKAQSLGIDKLQVSSRRFLVVKDKDGNGVPNCKLTVTDPASQKSASLVTAASGRAVLFPRELGLAGAKLTASTSCLSQNATSVSFDASDSDGAVQIKL